MKIQLGLKCLKRIYYYIQRFVQNIKQNMHFWRRKWVQMGGWQGGVVWFDGIGVENFLLKGIFG